MRHLILIIVNHPASLTGAQPTTLEVDQPNTHKSRTQVGKDS